MANKRKHVKKAALLAGDKPVRKRCRKAQVDVSSGFNSQTTTNPELKRTLRSETTGPGNGTGTSSGSGSVTGTGYVSPEIWIKEEEEEEEEDKSFILIDHEPFLEGPRPKPVSCLICTGEVMLGDEDVKVEVEESSSSLASAPLNSLFKILKISRSTFEFMLQNSSADLTVRYCASCQESVTTSCRLLLEIGHLQKALGELSDEIKGKFIQSYFCGSAAEGESSAIRKTLVQCWTRCRVNIKKLPPRSCPSQTQNSTGSKSSRAKRKDRKNGENKKENLNKNPKKNRRPRPLQNPNPTATATPGPAFEEGPQVDGSDWSFLDSSLDVKLPAYSIKSMSDGTSTNNIIVLSVVREDLNADDRRKFEELDFPHGLPTHVEIVYSTEALAEVLRESAMEKSAAQQDTQDAAVAVSVDSSDNSNVRRSLRPRSRPRPQNQVQAETETEAVAVAVAETVNEHEIKTEIKTDDGDGDYDHDNDDNDNKDADWVLESESDEDYSPDSPLLLDSSRAPHRSRSRSAHNSSSSRQLKFTDQPPQLQRPMSTRQSSSNRKSKQRTTRQKDTTKILKNRRERGQNPTCKKCDPQILFPSAAQLRKHDQEGHSMLKKPQKLQGLLKSIKCTYCHKTYDRTDFKISPDSEILHIKCDQAGCAATFSNFSLFSYHHGSTCLEKAKLIDTELQGDTVRVAGDEEKNCDSAGIIRIYSTSTGAGTGTGTGTNQEDDEEAESEAIRSRRMRNAQGPLKCKICGQGFRIQRRLEFHEERAHGEKTVQCPECPDMFPTLSTARVHQVRCHGKPLKVGYGPDGNLESFQCAYCSLEFFRKDYLVDDRSTNPPTKVFRKSIYPISNKILTEFKAFHWHHRRNCEHRPKMSHEDSTLSPAQNPSVSVSVSDKNNAGARAGRSSTRTTVKLEFPFPYACSVCGKRYKTLSSFEAHERVHRGELDHKCPHAECSLRFATIRKLSRHYSKAHPVETGEMGAKSFKYTCFPCKIVYDVKYELTKSGQKVLPCVFEKCKIVNASTDGHYKHHGKHHQKARGFKCKHCQKVFSRDHDFFLTERGERRFKCNFDGKCKKVFEKFQALWSHHRHHHNYKPGQPPMEKFDPERHVCKFCQRVFNKAWCCRTHEITVHTKAFKYYCEICGMGRPSLPKLKQHYASHTGERPYKCDQCPKTFKKTTDLKFHMNKHNDFRPYMCELCGKSYHNGNTLYMHKRIHQRRDELASNKGDKFGDETSSESERDGERSSSSDGD